MNVKNLLFVSLKLLGIYFTYQAITTLSQYTILGLGFNEYNQYEFYYFLSFIIHFLIYLTFIFLLIFKTNLLLKIILKEDYVPAPINEIDPKYIISIAMIIAGLMIIINEVPNFIGMIFSVTEEEGINEALKKSADKIRLIVSGVKIVIAYLFISNHAPISKWLAKRVEAE